MLRPGLLASTFALMLLPAAQQTVPGAAAPPPPDPNQALCATMLAQTNTIEIGGFPPDQLMSMAHGTSAPDLQMLASKSSDRGQHYEACVNYALSAAAYIAAGGKNARSNTSTAMSLAAIEQKQGDGKKLSFMDKMLKGTAKVSAVATAMAPAPAGGSAAPGSAQAAGAAAQPSYGGNQPAYTPAPAASGPAPPCDKPPCEL